MSERIKTKITTMQLYDDTWILVNSHKRCGESMDDAVYRIFTEHNTRKGEVK